MATDYYTREPSDERDTVERWENEGGRLRQKVVFILDSGKLSCHKLSIHNCPSSPAHTGGGAIYTALSLRRTALTPPSDSS